MALAVLVLVGLIAGAYADDMREVREATVKYRHLFGGLGGSKSSHWIVTRERSL